jgi:hypothetical protein
VKRAPLLAVLAFFCMAPSGGDGCVPPTPAEPKEACRDTVYVIKADTAGIDQGFVCPADRKLEVVPSATGSAGQTVICRCTWASNR